MAETKKGETKNQHYVPQFYQKNFSTNGKTIGAYNISKDINIEKAAIKHQASGDYFYSANMKIEGALGNMEAKASNIIESIIENPQTKLSKVEIYTLYAFTMIQLGRTLSQVKMIQENYNKMAKLVIRKYVEAKRNGPNAEEVSCLTDEILDNVQIDLKEPGLLALGTQSQLVNTCIDLECKVLINSTYLSFVTNDNPVCMYDPYFERMGKVNYALGSRGLVLFFPLSDKVALMYYDSKCYKLGDKKKKYVDCIQVNDIKELNKLTASNSNEVILFKDGSITKSEVESLAKSANRYKLVNRVHTFEGFKSGNSEFIGAENISLFCNLRLSFIKELPNFKCKTPETFDWNKDRLREIAYLKDDIIRMSRKKN